MKWKLFLRKRVYTLIYEVEGMRCENRLHSYDKYNKKRICKDEDLIGFIQNKSTRRSTDKLFWPEHGSRIRRMNDWIYQSKDEIVRKNILSKTV